MVAINLIGHPFPKLAAFFNFIKFPNPIHTWVESSPVNRKFLHPVVTGAFLTYGPYTRALSLTPSTAGNSWREKLTLARPSRNFLLGKIKKPFRRNFTLGFNSHVRVIIKCNLGVWISGNGFFCLKEPLVFRIRNHSLPDKAKKS